MARLLLCLSGMLVLIEAVHTQRLQGRRDFNRPYGYSKESRMQNRELPATRNSFYPSRNNRPYQRLRNIQRRREDLDTIPNQRVNSFQRRKGDLDARWNFDPRESSSQIYNRRILSNGKPSSFRPGLAGYKESTNGAKYPRFRSAFESQPRRPTVNGNRLRNSRTRYSPTAFSRRRAQRPRVPMRRRLNKSWKSSPFQKQSRDDRQKWISENTKLNTIDNIISKITDAIKEKIKEKPLRSWTPGPPMAVQDPMLERFPQPGKGIAAENQTMAVQDPHQKYIPPTEKRIEVKAMAVQDPLQAPVPQQEKNTVVKQVKNVATIVERTKPLPAVDIHKTNTTQYHPYLLQDFDPEFRPNTLALGATFNSPD